VFRPADARRFGETTAAMHSTMDRIAHPNSRPTWDLQWMLDQTLQALSHNSASPENLAVFKARAFDAKKRILELGSEDCDFGLIHADLHFGNATVDYTGRITFF
jgi:Ser/Thr protein kinase RdoA (MazF antagonist)